MDKRLRIYLKMPTELLLLLLLLLHINPRPPPLLPSPPLFTFSLFHHPLLISPPLPKSSTALSRTLPSDNNTAEPQLPCPDPGHTLKAPLKNQPMT